MKAIGFKKAGPISAPGSLELFESAKPELKPMDLLVQVKGISVNPVDYKVRTRMPPENGYKILGYDAAGIVIETGKDVRKFKVGDEVFYAGDITRQGTNAEYHAVDERIVGYKPNNLDFPTAAGMPLTSITAWELLFDTMLIKEGSAHGDSILIIGGAGGVGSILTQLAKKLTKLTVIATASRPESVNWLKKMGVDHIINHHQSMKEQINLLNLQPKYVASLTHSSEHFTSIVELISPRGHMVMIDDPDEIDIRIGKQKSLSFSFEFMFCRPKFNTADIIVQHNLLNRISSMLDQGILIPTVNQNLGKISVEKLKEAHRLQESGTVIGKNVMQGFE